MALSFIVLWNASLKVAGLNPIRLMWKLSDLTGCYPELEVLCVQQQDWDHTAPLHPLQHHGLVHFTIRDLSTSPRGTCPLHQQWLSHFTGRDLPHQQEGLVRFTDRLVHITDRDLSTSPTGTCPLQWEGLIHITNRDSARGTCPHHRQGLSERDLSTSPTGTQQEGLVHITDRDSAGGTCPPQREGLVHITNRDLSNSPTGTCPHHQQGLIQFTDRDLSTSPTGKHLWGCCSDYPTNTASATVPRPGHHQVSYDSRRGLQPCQVASNWNGPP